MKLLLDTHVLVWWLLDEPRLSGAQVAALEAAEKAGTPLGISAITLWEIAKLVELGRIDVRRPVEDVLASLESSSRVEVYPVDARVAVESTRLGPAFHRDPADQLIAATARVHGLHLVTVDTRIRAAEVVPVV